MPLGSMPIGTVVHNVEMHPGRGGQLARSAGASATVSEQVISLLLESSGSGCNELGSIGGNALVNNLLLMFVYLYSAH